MMPEDFRESLNAERPPNALSPLLAGLWWDAKGDCASA
jgi:hypothetical protein